MATSKTIAKWRGLTSLGALRQAVIEAEAEVLHGGTHQNAHETYLNCQGKPGVDLYIIERRLSDGSVVHDIEIDPTDAEAANVDAAEVDGRIDAEIAAHIAATERAGWEQDAAENPGRE